MAHQNCVYACPTPIQEAVARAFELELKRIESPECYFTSISVDLQKRRDMIVNILEEAGLPPVVPEGGYFIMADWTPLSRSILRLLKLIITFLLELCTNAAFLFLVEEKVDLSSENDAQSDFRFAKWLSKNKGLQGIPPTAFFSEPHKNIGENYIRFCFIKVK